MLHATHKRSPLSVVRLALLSLALAAPPAAADVTGLTLLGGAVTGQGSWSGANVGFGTKGYSVTVGPAPVDDSTPITYNEAGQPCQTVYLSTWDVTSAGLVASTTAGFGPAQRQTTVCVAYESTYSGAFVVQEVSAPKTVRLIAHKAPYYNGTGTGALSNLGHKSADFNVVPITVQSLTCPASLNAGTIGSVRVTLTAKSLSALSVNLASSNATALKAPTTVGVTATTLFADFQVGAAKLVIGGPSLPTTVTLTAALGTGKATCSIPIKL